MDEDISKQQPREPSDPFKEREEVLEEKTLEVPLESPRKPSTKSTKMKVMVWLLLILIVLAGLIIGFFIGFMINMSACWKQTCSPLEEGAPIWLPVASFFFTIPLTQFIYRKMMY